MLTLSDSAHSEERASPRKPKVRTEVRSEKEASFDVWCFSAIYDRVSIGNREHKWWQHTYGFIILRCDTSPIINDLERL